jgi:hypothetical protein
MADNAVVLLDTLLAERERLRGGELPEDEAFELFTFEQALKEEDLSEDRSPTARWAAAKTVASTACTAF